MKFYQILKASNWGIALGMTLAAFSMPSCARREPPPPTTPSATRQPALQSTQGDLRLTLPSWCSQQQLSEQLCFHCERRVAPSAILYEQCFKPGDGFIANRDCVFMDGATKSIQCEGTSGGGTFDMDISTAKERLSATMPAFILGLDLALKQKNSEPPREQASFLLELAQFLAARLHRALEGEDQDSFASDFSQLINNALPLRLNDDQLQNLKGNIKQSTEIIAQELHGKKDYSLSRIILRGLATARTIPPTALGPAKDYLKGSTLASLIQTDEAGLMLKTLKILPSQVTGTMSLESLADDLSREP